MVTVHKQLICIDLFAGAGGLSLGAQQAGLRVVSAVEENESASTTYASNHARTEVIRSDVRMARQHFKGRRCDILFGGPPCQGFSISNQRTRNVDNPKNWLFLELFTYVRMLRPDWIVIENVAGLTETSQGFFLDEIKGRMQRLDYRSAVWTLNAVDFGVPQRRKRVFIVGRLGADPPMPPKRSTHEPVTVRDAISDLPRLASGASISSLPYVRPPESAYQKLMRGDHLMCSGHLVTANNELVLKRYKHVPPGGNWRDIPRRLMRNYSNLVDARSLHTGIYKRLRWGQPSIVIANFRKNMLIHPAQNRGLSIREAARIQSFPDWYEFHGSIGFQQQQISNAVPPLLAKHVFLKILSED